MPTRRRCLPAGWYPDDSSEIRKLFSSWQLPQLAQRARAVLSPHAGWAYSGRLAALAWVSLAPADTLVVVGGHLGLRSPLLYAPEGAFETGLGSLSADSELLSGLLDDLRSLGISSAEDREVDNTVEVQLPFASLLFPASRLVWLRAPANETAIEIGRSLQRQSARLGRSIDVVASSDLTHFGPDYSFEPLASRPDPVAWLRDSNDKAYLDAVLALDGPASLTRARLDRSACSPGAVATAIGFALAGGAARGELLAYATSHEVRKAASFVGYAALGFY